DKKGRPITNLKPEDFEIFDEGQKANLRFFSQAGSPEAGSSTAPPGSAAPAEHLYANRRPTPVITKGDVPGNTIVLLIDANLSFDDLSLAREQMGRFLAGLREGEHVALYAMRVGTFQVLEEGTTDHQRVAATLAKWKPSAQSVSLGEEQEDRNRQKMETVANMEDLLNVNGHMQNDPDTAYTPLDAKLRPLGDRPGQTALDALVVVARHLGAIPGHKSLVWIASDNVLADWTRMSVTIEKGSHFIDAAALRTQEAMNNAHVSVYPLDVSRLEAGVISASIGTRNVEITPTNLVRNVPSLERPLEGPEYAAGIDVNLQPQRDFTPGRMISQMQQDLHPIQGAFREIAEATGGRIFPRSSNIAGELDGVAADGRATYLLSFSPAQAADGKYHLITVRMASRREVTLRYRTGYFYRQESATLKQRFSDAVWQPEDAAEIALTADPVPESNGHALRLSIAATDLEIAQKDALWTDKIDVFVVQREVSGSRAKVTGQTLGLRLKPGSYQKYLREGIPFNQTLEFSPGAGSVRIVVLDENSGRMGTLTVPAVALTARN
ncbi:MAG: VWA domain-containing protein, partial [Terracidiphilus sp.]